jgi:hypothetical protein
MTFESSKPANNLVEEWNVRNDNPWSDDEPF